MFDPSSFVNPTPLAHADTSRNVLTRGGTSQVFNMTILRFQSFRKYTLGNLTMETTENLSLFIGKAQPILEQELKDLHPIDKNDALVDIMRGFSTSNSRKEEAPDFFISWDYHGFSG
ncbi:hypothetical protein TNCV_2605851 [Trichonephila clavipes]|nr:hypothetical protein TNCV_2605851 [Trichonephila clavipes]